METVKHIAYSDLLTYCWKPVHFVQTDEERPTCESCIDTQYWESVDDLIELIGDNVR